MIADGTAAKVKAGIRMLAFDEMPEALMDKNRAAEQEETAKV